MNRCNLKANVKAMSLFQIHQLELSIVTGYMEFSDMRPVARDIGRAGTEQPLSSFVLVDFFTTKILMLVTGQKMYRDVKSIVRYFITANRHTYIFF